MPVQVVLSRLEVWQMSAWHYFKRTNRISQRVCFYCTRINSCVEIKLDDTVRNYFITQWSVVRTDKIQNRLSQFTDK